MPETKKIPRLLVIEDTPRDRELTVELAKGAGFKVDVAGRLEEAYALLRNNEYRAVISDLDLPQRRISELGEEVTPIELLAAAKEINPNMHVAVYSGARGLAEAINGTGFVAIEKTAGAVQPLKRFFNHARDHPVPEKIIHVEVSALEHYVRHRTPGMPKQDRAVLMATAQSKLHFEQLLSGLSGGRVHRAPEQDISPKRRERRGSGPLSRIDERLFEVESRYGPSKFKVHGEEYAPPPKPAVPPALWKPKKESAGRRAWNFLNTPVGELLRRRRKR